MAEKNNGNNSSSRDKQVLRLDVIVPGAQHFIECSKCHQYADYYCNSCSYKLCELCITDHLKTNASENHNVVLYCKRSTTSPITESCTIHPDFLYLMCCEQCEVPVCSKCITENHPKHKLVETKDFLMFTSKNWTEQVSRIKNEILPRCCEDITDIKTNISNHKGDVLQIRTAMIGKAEALKHVVDLILDENLNLLDGMEKSLNNQAQEQERLLNDYIEYLQSIVNEYDNQTKDLKPYEFVLYYKEYEISNLRPMPPVTDLAVLSFLDSEINKEDIYKQFGKVIETTPIAGQHRNISALTKKDTVITELKSSKVARLSAANHLCCLEKDDAWVSDKRGIIVQTDLHGNKLQKVNTSSGLFGSHTVTPNKELLFTDQDKKCINKLTPDRAIETLIKTGKWKPISIFASHSNGDILVGMKKENFSKVTRFNATGEELQEIYLDEKNQFMEPWYITENLNGDVCISNRHLTEQLEKSFVVTVDKSKIHRFRYKGQKGLFLPSGICTDMLGRILIYDSANRSIHLLDQNGTFVSILLQLKFHFDIIPQGLCIDEDMRLWIGDKDIIRVFKYLSEDKE